MNLTHCQIGHQVFPYANNGSFLPLLEKNIPDIWDSFPAFLMFYPIAAVFDFLNVWQQTHVLGITVHQINCFLLPSFQ